MILLVCGGRDYLDAAAVHRALDALHAFTPVTLLRHGGARGADSFAHQWAREHGVPTDPCPADWPSYGKRAGTVRNQAMLVKAPLPELVIAFPGGKGTADMVRRARAAQVATRVVCRGCGEATDPTVCECGDLATDHGRASGHAFVEMGCRCASR